MSCPLPLVSLSSRSRNFSERGASTVSLLFLVGWLLSVCFAALLLFRAYNELAVAEAQAELAAANDRAMEQALNIERVLSERLAQDAVDLGEVRVALLSPANAQDSPRYAVVWSPASGEGVLLRIASVDLPATVDFRLIASRQSSRDRIEQETIFAKAAPASLDRGLFRYQTPHPNDVSAFTLEITSSAASGLILRFGGGLSP